MIVFGKRSKLSSFSPPYAEVCYLYNESSDQNAANELKNQASFTQLDGKLQSFVLQISAGHTKMEDLLRHEAVVTREHVTREVQHANTSVKDHISGEMLDRKRLDESRRQRERLLESLRFPEMNQRRNDITDPKDATFRRVFRSFERTAGRSSFDSAETDDQYSSDEESLSSSYEGTLSSLGEEPMNLHEIDECWQSFVAWLRSDEPLFWIQGNPGSGKSTLVKHIVANEATGKLLDEWSPSTKIVTHYFFLIGTTLQSNITGFYCSLIHQLLEGDQAFSDQIFRRLPITTSKQHTGDWSISELQELLGCVLDLQAEDISLCLFIDGLDEYTGKDGQYGLLDRLQTIYQRPKVKVCVSSRPEPKLLQRLHSQPNLRLQDLTRPDMELYIQRKLSEFSERGTISKQLLSTLTHKLLEKSRGVFLWLVLALQSIKDGIHNDDSKEFLMLRLQELPSELESLYETMWKKANADTSVYRESAADYLRSVLLAVKAREIRHYHFPTKRETYFSFTFDREIAVRLPGISLFEMICMNTTGIGGRLLDLEAAIHFEEVTELYERTEREIRVRCAGLLEIVRGDRVEIETDRARNLAPTKDPLRAWLNFRATQVRFIHRTVHDFLIHEKGGQDILRHSKKSSEDLCFSFMGAFLCFVRLLHQEVGLAGSLIELLSICQKFLIQGMKSTDKMLGLLPVVKRFYERDLLEDDRHNPMKPHFLSLLIYFPQFDRWLHQQLGDLSAETATAVLRDFWMWLDISNGLQHTNPSVEVIQRLLSRGADPFAVRL